jgi:hypothetical protein
MTDNQGPTAGTVSREEAAEIQRTYLNLIAARDAADAYRAKLATRVPAEPSDPLVIAEPGASPGKLTP